MIGRNIRYCRLQKGVSQAELGRIANISSKEISDYEKGKRIPDYKTYRKLSQALGVPINMFLVTNYDELDIYHGTFRKLSNVSKRKQEVIYNKVDHYLGRLYEIVSLIDSSVLPITPEFKRVVVDNYEIAGKYLREILELPSTGPIGNITDILENKGFIICPIEFDNNFSGINGKVNERPYIVVNTAMSAERQRFTLIHELAHIVFRFNEQQQEEKIVDGIAGAFLLPKDDIIRELGIKRKDIRGDLRDIKREYGISMSAILMRAMQTEIINKKTFEMTMKWMSANGLRKEEAFDMIAEEAHLLEQLTYRAVLEEKIGISKAAEILERPIQEVRSLCYEVSEFVH